MSHQRWFWGIHHVQVTKLALKRRADTIKSLKRGYQWPHKKLLLFSKRSLFQKYWGTKQISTRNSVEFPIQSIDWLTNARMIYYLYCINAGVSYKFLCYVCLSPFIYSFPLKCKETVTKLIHLVIKFNIIATWPGQDGMEYTPPPRAGYAITHYQGSHFFPLTKFPDFSNIFFIFPWLLLNIFSCHLFKIYFLMHGLHLLLGNCIKSLDALKYSFYNTQK